MSTLVYTKAAAQSTKNDFEQLCERCCWPTLDQQGQLHALLYPEEAIRSKTWQEGQRYLPMHLSVFRAADGSIGFDGDYSRLRIAAGEIFKALNGEQADLPRPSQFFCQQYSLTRHQAKLKSEGLSSDLVQDEVTGEWCLDVEVPGTERSMEASLS